jgi:hypothetical protein
MIYPTKKGSWDSPNAPKDRRTTPAKLECCDDKLVLYKNFDNNWSI